jgi:hypothetical protein
MLFGTDVPGFGIPPIDGNVVKDSRTWRRMFDDDSRFSNPDFVYESDDSSEYSKYVTNPRSSLEGLYETRQTDLRHKTTDALEDHIVDGYLDWSDDGFVDIRPARGFGFAGLWLQEIGFGFKLGMIVRALTGKDSYFQHLYYDQLPAPVPASPLLPVMDDWADVDDPSAKMKTFYGRPFMPPLPWLGSYPSQRLPPDAILSKKIGAQAGAVRLFITCDIESDLRSARDISVLFSHPTRLLHIHGMEITYPAHGSFERNGHSADAENQIFGTGGFATTLAHVTKLYKLQSRRAAGLKVGMVENVYERMPPISSL